MKPEINCVLILFFALYLTLQHVHINYCTELGREPYQSEVNEATERELAILA